MESSFTHPSTHQLFCYHFGVATPSDLEQVEAHLKICGPCRDALEGLERNHPAPESLQQYAVGQLYFAQSNVIRLHATKCLYCVQVVEQYRIRNAELEAAAKEGPDVEALASLAFPLHIANDESARMERSGDTDGLCRGRRNLREIDIAGFFELGGAIANCLAMGRQPLESYESRLAALKALLSELFTGDLQQGLERASPTAAHLHEVIIRICDKDANRMCAALEDEEFLEFSEACGALDRAIAKDLGSAAVYYLEAKGGFDARKLIAGVDEIFADARAQLPDEAVDDINQAGTCLALSLATGAAFHIVRATKTVIQGRIEALGGRAPVGYERNLQGYVRALRGMSGSEECRLEPLMEIRQDPVSDPEVTMTMSEAIVVWAKCTDAIRSIIDKADCVAGTGQGANLKRKKLRQSA